MAKPVVIVFARAPRYGAVKTRLAKDIGPAEALRFYRSALARLLRRIGRDGRWDVVLSVTPDGAARGSWPAGTRVTPQGGGDLGRRMVRALLHARPRPAVVIGSDIPALTNAHLAAAFRALGSASMAFGPASDGGYWLIGARPSAPLPRAILDGVRWSSPHALRDSIAKVPGGVVLDAVLDDVDDGAAYKRVAALR
jgi:uncharacterized protein